MKNYRGIVLIILEIVFMIIFFYSVYNIYKWYTENKKTSEILNNITSSITVDKDKKQVIDFTALMMKNPDVVAYLKVNGTGINYPVVIANDNEYYLSHSFDKSLSGAGWIFADYRNRLDGTDKNLIIYGHNRRDDSMFGTLKNVLNKDWYENNDNKYISLNTQQGDITYEVFSVYRIKEEDYYLKTKFNNESFVDFANTLKLRSIKNFETELTEDDSILTLSTCANDNRYRVVLHAKKIG